MLLDSRQPHIWRNNKKATEPRHRRDNGFWRQLSLRFVFTFVVTAGGIIAAYYSTIAGIRLDLERKADLTVVAEIDKKLSTIEVILNRETISRKDFYDFREEVLRRLSRIEAHLER